jgi:hypothetical protein
VVRLSTANGDKLQENTDGDLPLMSIYKRTRDEHWLRDKQAEGVALILEDDSTWEIHPSDHSITARWLRGSIIYVEITETKGYPYVLRNHTEGETARANFLGEFRAVG